jgi:hypothetical protein
MGKRATVVEIKQIRITLTLTRYHLQHPQINSNKIKFARLWYLTYKLYWWRSPATIHGKECPSLVAMRSFCSSCGRMKNCMLQFSLRLLVRVLIPVAARRTGRREKNKNNLKEKKGKADHPFDKDHNCTVVPGYKDIGYKDILGLRMNFSIQIIFVSEY